MDYIGIDVHKIHSQVCILADDGTHVERRIRTERGRLAAILGARPRARVLLESSTESEWVARVLEEFGHEVVVVDPNFGPMYTHRSSRLKTDLRDARMLCEAARLGTYRPAHRCSSEQRHVRADLMVREALVRTRSRYICVIRNLLRQEGIHVRSGAATSFGMRVGELTLPAAMTTTLAPLLSTLETLTAHIAQADRHLAQATAADETLQRLTTLPGVGPVTATTFVATLDGHARFQSAAQVRAFLGLVPREYSSGETVRRGRITKAGGARARVLLVEAAWSIVRSKHDTVRALKTWAARVADRRGKAIAVVALARRLAGILYAMWRDGRDFDPTRLGRSPIATAPHTAS